VPNRSPSPPLSATNLIAIAGGDFHSLGIRSDGSLLGWGSDFYGQISVPADKQFIEVAAGQDFSLALRGDGTVLAWGRNELGQTNVPPAATNIVSIAAGRGHAMALRQDGRIFVWGDTNAGRGSVPSELTFASAIECGNQHNLALRGMGEVRFVRQPLTQTVAGGRQTLLSTFASGSGPIHYQWTLNGTNILGATNAYLVIPDSQEWTAGDYAVIAVGSTSAKTSMVATVTVTPSAPEFVQQPSSQQVRAGQDAVLSASAAGSAPLRFQWQLNGADLGGATNAVLTLPNAQVADSGNYRMIASNPLGVATSAVARLEIYPFEVLPTAVTTNGAGPVAWGDYDNDGLLDLLAGRAGLWHNNGNGSFTNVEGITNEFSVAWGDFDNDGFLDIVAMNPNVGGEIWHNNRDGTFRKLAVTLPIDYNGGTSVIDFDNDGRLDVLIGGRLSRNIGNDQFAYMGNIFPVTEYSSNAWGDYDNDGFADVLICGLVNGGARLLLYRNLGNGSFTNVSAGLPQIYRGSVAWIDFDADGRRDVLLAGEYGSGARITELYRNNGNGTFSPVGSGFPPTSYAALATGDHNNDGLTDVFLSGNSAGRLYEASIDGSFSAVFSPFPTNVSPVVAWGDYDRNGTLDLAMSVLAYPNQSRVDVYRNYTGRTNVPPGRPPNASAGGSVNGITFRWSNSSDVETPTEALTYHLRVGRTPGAGDVLAANADANGVRRLAAIGNAEAALAKTIQGLPFGTYHWAVQAVDSAFAGSRFTEEQVFTYATGTGPATGVDSARATLHGILDTNQLPAAAWFEWGSETNLPANTPAETITAGGGFSAALDGLMAGTRYYFRAAISNTSGVFYGTVRQFTTIGVPTAATLNVSNITSSSARFTAGVNPNRGTTLAWFEYGLSESYGSSTAATNVGGGEGLITLDQSVSNLLGGTVYYVRVAASNHAGVAYGNGLTFTTTHAPEALTLPAAPIGVTNATLNGEVKANGLSTAAYFEYGQTPSYGQRTEVINVGTQSAAVAVSAPIAGLIRNLNYYYRLVAENSFATNYGIGRSFRTTNDVVTYPATAVTMTSATLNGLVNPAGMETMVYFQFGVTLTPPIILPAGTNSVALSHVMTNLARETLYQFRVVASNAAGVRRGDFLSFATPWIFGVTTSSIPAVVNGAIVSGDFNNDGSMDLVVASASATRLYANSMGSFTPVGPALPGISPGGMDSGDFDNDGWLDLLIAGRSGGSTAISKLFRNNRDGSFTEVPAGFAPIESGSIKWGDYDTDGRPDVLVAGANGDTPISRLYRNDGNGTFTEQSIAFPEYLEGGAIWCDYNKDGRLDITIWGRMGTSNVFTKILRNNGHGTFAEVAATFPGIRIGTAAWADYNADGWPDLLLAGRNAQTTDLFRLWRNNGNDSFSDVTGGLPSFAPDAAMWGDYDNDGRMDILARGQKYIFPSQPPRSYSAVARNNGNGTFTYGEFPLPEIWSSAGGWIDVDGDHRLDVVISGNGRTGPKSIIYHNEAFAVNTPPNAPPGLVSAVSNSTVRLSWQPGSDGETPASALTYNLCVGTNSRSGNIVSPLAGTNGYRRIVAPGNAGQNMAFELTGLTPGWYFWSVQSVDSGFEGSPFSAEASFFIGAPMIRYVRPEGERILIGISGIANTSYALEASTNLIEWSVVATSSVSDNGTSAIEQPRTTAAARFFRLRTL
jgi:hypothetical protein